MNDTANDMANASISGYSSERGVVNDLAVSIGVVGFFLNAVTIFIFFRKRGLLGKNQRLILLNQSAIDLVSSAVLIYSHYYSYYLGSLLPVEVPHSRAYCMIIWSLVLSFGLVCSSTWNLQVLTVERYLSICHPVQHFNFCTSKYLYVVLLLVWPLGTVFTSLSAINMRFYPDLNICTYVSGDAVARLAYAVSYFTVMLLMPLFLITFCYARMFLTLKHRIFKSSGEQKEKLNRKRSFLIIACTIGVTYIICFMWSTTYFVLASFGLVTFSVEVDGTVLIMSVANCFINPIIFIIKMSGFRDEVINLFTCNRVAPEPGSL